MHADYTDILRRVHSAPEWWDSNGVPRFDKYRPEDSPAVYAEESALLLVSCVECGAVFKGEVNSGPFRGSRVLEVMCREGEVVYGNPPRHDCMGDGTLATTVKVLEFWKRRGIMEWVRVRRLEGEVRREEGGVGPEIAGPDSL